MVAIVSRRGRQRWRLVKFSRSVWTLLFIGAALRCIALNQPLLDAHLLRQCQTAEATKSYFDAPHFQLSARIPWLGDHDAHYVQEFPIYNYLAVFVTALTHDVDLSGKLTSVLLWIASFICLQFIWRRLLSERETFWANLLFVFAPLSVFFGQAVMPEMLVQFLAFAFVLSILRYREDPSLSRWWICAAIGFLGLLVKLPEIAHLYLLVAFVIVRGRSWREILRVRYLIAAALTIVFLKSWSGYTDSINRIDLPEWTATSLLTSFIGPAGMRLHLKPWLMIASYVGGLIFAGPSALAALYGLSILVRRSARSFLFAWVVALAIFYLVWFGNGATGQSYYNLPALAPLSALFGIGAAMLISLGRSIFFRGALASCCALLLILPSLAIDSYLFTQDRQLRAAIAWVKTNTQPTDIILFRPAHRWDLIDYPQDAVLAHCAQRSTFVYTPNTPEKIRDEGLRRSRFAVVTLPQEESGNAIVDLIRRNRGVHPPVEPSEWLARAGFRLREDGSEFQIYERDPAL